jgi:phosphoglycolate phosphatase-like HAD superfamily hydrolase
MKEKSLLIMDMDGVLIDVSGSYRDVVRHTVQYYLRGVIGADCVPAEALTPEDISAIKKSGGLNNDWELTYAVLNTILNNYFDEENEGAVDSAVNLKIVESDRDLLSRGKSILKSCDCFSLARLGEVPLADVYSEKKPASREDSPFLFNRGDVGSGNLVKRIFQELYLGPGLFRETYGDDPFFYKGRGYMDRETLIPEKKQLESLDLLCKLAIATGRPGSEAHHALINFGISGMFEAVVTEDDVVMEEARRKQPLRKPHPYVIESCIEKYKSDTTGDVYYLGDMPDDMTAAKRAGVVPIGYVDDGLDMVEEERKEHHDLLFQKGAREVFGSYDDLIGYIESYTDRKS